MVKSIVYVETFLYSLLGVPHNGEIGLSSGCFSSVTLCLILVKFGMWGPTLKIFFATFSCGSYH